MRWRHRVSLSWLQQRQNHLTATDIKDLLPYTNTGRDKKITEWDYVKVYSRKMTELTEDDCWSEGVAARGHLLEPYAINSFNAITSGGLYHWDDCVIYNENEFGLSYSPDGLNIDCQQFIPRPTKSIPNPTLSPKISCTKIEPTMLGEVKSYGVEKHYKTAYTAANKLEERWQIATAMTVNPTIKEAFLVLYNPDIKIKDEQVFIVKYNREDLLNEIDTIKKIEKNWLEFVKAPTVYPPYAQGKSSITSEKIKEELKISPLGL